MTEDLVSLFAPAPAGPSQDVRWRQGTVRAFDANTLANTVDVGGTLMTDLPLLGVAEASSLAPGSVVGLLAIESTLGTVSYAILGRLVLPNTAAAVDAVSLLSSWISTSAVSAQETTSSPTLGDLTTYGPEVHFNVRPSGRILVIATCQEQQVSDGPESIGGYYTIQLSGANVRSGPSMTSDILGTRAVGFNGAIGAWADQNTITVTRVLEGLNPGLTTATMKYASYYTRPWDMGRRSLTVLTL